MSLINLNNLKQRAASCTLTACTLLLVSCAKPLPELPAVSPEQPLPTLSLTQLTEEEIRRNRLARSQAADDSSDAYEIVDLSSLKIK